MTIVCSEAERYNALVLVRAELTGHSPGRPSVETKTGGEAECPEVGDLIHMGLAA